MFQYTKTTLNYDVTEVDTVTLKINGTAITKTASEINAMPNDDDIDNATPVNAEAATGTLTISGVAIDGETVTIGTDVYEFCADTAQSLTGGSDFAIDITSFATKAQGTLTVDTQPTSGDTMTIGSKTYTFVPDGTANADGEVNVGSDLADAKVDIVAAINGTDGYNVAHTQVSAAAFATDDCVITALVGGVAGNSLASTETFTAGTNVFDAATLGTTTAGVDCTAANAVTAIVTSVTANDTAGVGAADGTGDTVVLTADTKGVAGNSIASTETMANGAFGAATLENGVDGTVGVAGDSRYDNSYLYVCLATNTIADANWRRLPLRSLALDGTVALADNETLTFGDGLDVKLKWDGTNLIIEATADDSLIEIGDSGATQKSFDLKIYANDASGGSYTYFDASRNMIETTKVELNTRKRFDLMEDFVMPTINETDFPVILNSTGDANDPSIAANSKDGMLTITTSGTDDQTSQVVVSIPVSADKGNLVFETRLACTTDVENVCIFAGLTDVTTLEMPVEISGTTITTTASDAVGFVFDTDQTTDQWYAVGVAADTDATGNAITDTAPTADVYQVLRIEVSADGSTAYFYINGTLKGTLTANAVTAATSVYATVCVENRSGAANTVTVDYIYVGHDR